MLLRGLIILFLYINYVIASSVTNFLDQKQFNSDGVDSFSPIPSIIASRVSSVLIDNVVDSGTTIGAYSLEKSLLKNHEQQLFSSEPLENNANLSNRREISKIDSLDYGSHFLSKDLDGKEVIIYDESDKPEMHTNNHQSLNSINNVNNHHGGQNSRHYNAHYQLGNGISGHYSNPKFAATLHSASSPLTSSSGNSLNLNYIHALLTKPSSSTQNGYSTSPTHQPYMYSPKFLHQQSQQPSQLLSQSSNHEQQQNNNSSIISFDSSALPICGKQQVGSREPRIVGGNSTYEGEFPWAVSIQRHGNHHCGGVIVGKRWILTAAHCVRSQLVGNLIVRTGCHTLTKSINNINSHLEHDYLVDQIIMHTDFTASQMRSPSSINNADIALLRLKHDIHWNEFAWPVCFPNREAGNFSGHDAIVIGWGKLNEKSEDFSNELQKVKLTIIDNKACQNWFRQAGREMPIDDRIICAGFKNGGKDACHGDSGGPLLSKINGHHVVVGVVSTGIGCARPLLPGLYSRVSSYIGWIERHVS